MPRRARQFHLRFLVVLTAVSAVGMTLFLPVDRPSIAVLQSEIDVGAVAVGSSGTCNFILENCGSGPVRVRAGGTSGTSRIVGSYDYTIPENTRQTIVIRWTLRSPLHPASPTTKNELLRWSYQLMTNDPKRPVINLSIVGRSL